MNELINLQNNVEQRKAVKDFMVSTLKDLVVQKVIAGEPVTGFTEAFVLVNKLFEELDKKFSK